MADKIDGFILDQIDVKCVKVRTVPALDLLRWNRLDLGFKLFYLRHRKVAPDIAEKVYKHDIIAQTLGTYSEIGNADKNSFEKYISAFEYTAECIAMAGFVSETSLIPIATDGSILNGAHRTAACIDSCTDAVVLDTGLAPIACDYAYFRKRGVPEHAIQFAVREFVRHKPNTHIAFLWPSGRVNLKASLAEFSNIIYATDIKLSPRGAFNLIREIYRHMDWIGDRANGFAGVKRKLGECFTDMSPVTIVVFHQETFENVLALKALVRQINGIGFSSIHITDTHEEARDVADLIFCENGRYFLNTADLDKFEWEDKLAAFLAETPAPADKCVIDSGFVMELFGLRSANDIDAVIEDCYLRCEGLDADIHEHDLHHHGIDKSTLIHDPRNFFVFRGQRYLTLAQIRRMKASRGEAKDKIDVRLIDSNMERSAGKALLLSIQQRAFHTYHRTKMTAHRWIRDVLQRLGVLEKVKALVRRSRYRN